MENTSNLSARCEASFNDDIRARGEEHFKDRKVGTLKVSGAGLVSIVSDKTLCNVHMFWGNTHKFGALHCSCTCPYFIDDNLCQHIWAVILKADQDGVSTRVAGRRRLMVMAEQETSNLLAKFAKTAGAPTAEPAKPPPGARYKFERKRPPVYDFRETPNSDSTPEAEPAVVAPAALSESVKDWTEELQTIKSAYEVSSPLTVKSVSEENKTIYYVLDREKINADHAFCVKLYATQKYSAHGEPQLAFFNLQTHDVTTIKNDESRRTLNLLVNLADRQKAAPAMNLRTLEQAPSLLSINADFLPEIISTLCRTKSFFKDLASIKRFVASGAQDFLNLDDGELFNFIIDVVEDGGDYKLEGQFVRGLDRFGLAEIDLCFKSGYFLSGSTFYKFTANEVPVEWVRNQIQTPTSVRVPANEASRFLEEILNSRVPSALPPALAWPKLDAEPTVHAVFKTEPGRIKRITLSVDFDYGLQRVNSFSKAKAFVDHQKKEISLRNFQFEKDVIGRFNEILDRKHEDFNSVPIETTDFGVLIKKCAEEKWHVEAEGRKVHQASKFNVSVTSGIDWLELDAQAQFGDLSASMPHLLDALSKQETLFQLSDGSYGVIPSEWLEKYAALAKLGVNEDAAIRFSPNQAMLLDTWLANEANVDFDAGFKRLQRNFHELGKIEPRKEPATFKGKLRTYQREGLGWLHSLRGLNFGGILADDMGLGKTVQCLAFLEGNLSQEKKRKPSLIIVPKSLIFNWIDEAQKFTPSLKVLSYNGSQRKEIFQKIKDHDIVLTTYHTLRIDIENFKDVDFNCVIIDEAQNIKNRESLVAKAVKLVKADFRLAMTGTPVENSLDDLFSIMEFANPGMLASKTQKQFTDESALRSLSRALSPFILRRTKAQVLKDLPSKSEQTVHVELHDNHRQEYDELRRFFKSKLSQQISEKGVGKSQIQILTALLRLRQAALHPGLLDEKRVGEPSAKLDLLVEHLNEAIGENHKSLVFSQFTSLLKIVQLRLNQENISYQYIDGKTADRQKAVKSFKEDSKCNVFLISLKAGGTGLNLTEADYVFLLDPWWNPAVEAQAIDRAHRIGQKNTVLAYKFIAKDTVEEKILELQKTKRHVADSVINPDKSFIRGITAADINLLFS